MDGAVTPIDDRFEVKSQSSDDTYTVNILERTCNCPDAGKGYVCKHFMAVEYVAHQLIPV